ncbi:MAG TPA: bifunctional hydroxymethylpyrimidine kinase/phosphomethylpyrimidine kinase [Candidatus Polarisedimenticolaceae bacterium]|nr:bifunctional hydroxymethylpyrimidine kinase/phosphomethylpyrimidine kinase [Candidatus Polarisedimenticolaceae bacterium]
MRPTVLTVAGSDSSGGAGIQADLKAIAACGGHGASVITALTAQNTTGVRAAEPVSAAMVRAQLDAVLDDLDVRAVKTGMLATAELVATVAERLAARRPPSLVCDPVMVAKSGDALLAPDAVDAVRERMLPLATLLTPNTEEAEALAGRPVRTLQEAAEAGRALRARGAAAVLVKGGHLSTPGADDVLVTAEGVRVFEGERLDARHTHGTGCTYAAAIATFLAFGHPLPEAVGRAKRFLTEAIRHGLAVGRGIGPTDPFWDRGRPARVGVERVGRLHVLSHAGDGLALVAAEEGADVVQVRDKGASTTAQRVAAAREALAAARPRGVRVVVNDRVDVAAEAGADGVHLGRHDLTPETARRILGEHALVGGTANSLEEAVAWVGRPVDYLGVGPVFGTETKADPAPALGLPALAAIVRAVHPLPVIAIGNVTPERVGEILAAGAHGVAVSGAVARAADPRAAVRALRRAVEAGRSLHA